MNAYLFDVDGVLSDPKEKRVTQEELFDELIYLLMFGDVVCLNTGRSLVWMEERVIDPVLEKIGDKKHLERFIAIGEKGGAWMTFDSEGKKYHEIDRTISVPQELQQEVRTLIENQYKDSMFFDATKETMLSIEMNDGFDIPKFHEAQQKLNEDIKKILEQRKLTDQYKIDPTVIATDIENNHVGKAFGADRFLSFLESKQLSPEFFTAFGDSKSDFEMADELQNRGKQVSFVFVGDKAKLGDIQKPYAIEYVEGFTQGTLVYLTK